MRRSLAFPVLVLSVGIAVASSAAILIRLGQDAGGPPIFLAAGRLATAAMVLTLVFPMWPRRVFRPTAAAITTPPTPAIGAGAAADQRPTGRDVALTMAAGVLLAAHFGSWFASLAFTSVTSSAMLVSTTPIFVAIAGWLWLGERVTWPIGVGIGLAVAGSLVLTLPDTAVSATTGTSPPPPAGAVAVGGTWVGDGLALVGAMTVAGYLLIGRRVRARMALGPYIGLTYGVAALVLVGAAGVEHALTGVPWPLESPVIWGVMIGLALGPQLLGHTALNWALKVLPATFVALALLGEPIGTMILATIILDRPPTGPQLIGGAILLAGIGLTAVALTTPPSPARSPSA